MIKVNSKNFNCIFFKMSVLSFIEVFYFDLNINLAVGDGERI